VRRGLRHPPAPPLFPTAAQPRRPQPGSRLAQPPSPSPTPETATLRLPTSSQTKLPIWYVCKASRWRPRREICTASTVSVGIARRKSCRCRGWSAGGAVPVASGRVVASASLTRVSSAAVPECGDRGGGCGWCPDRAPGEFLRAENRAAGSAARCIRVALTAGTRYGDVVSVT
jgi:hypothetical protein